MGSIEEVFGIFSDFAPVRRENGLFLRNWQSMSATCNLYPFEHPMEDEWGSLDRALVRFSLDKKKIPVFSVGDFLLLNQNSHVEKSAIAGLIAERVAHLSSQYWLEYFVPGTIQNVDMEPNHTIRNSKELVLKVNSYNRIILLRQEEEVGKYRVLTDLDGLFFLNDGKDDYIVIVESKFKDLHLRLHVKKKDLFDPISELFPEHKMIYMIYDDMNSIYKGGQDDSRRKRWGNQLKNEPVRIYDYLTQLGVGTLFFGFRGYDVSLKDMTEHLFVLQNLYTHNPVWVNALVEYSRISLYAGKSPFLIMYRQGKNMWRHHGPRKKRG